MTDRILLFVLSFALLAGCVNTAEKSADDMADFADDQEFKDAHEDPRAAAATYSAYALMAESESDECLLVFHEWWGEESALAELKIL